MKAKFTMFFTLLVIMGTFMISCKTGKADYKFNENGIGYLFHTKNSNAQMPENGDILSMKLAYGAPDSVYFHTDSIPEKKMILPMVTSEHAGDLYEALAMMHLGDSVSFLLPAETFFLKTAHFPEIPFFAKGVDKLLFNIKLDKIQTEEQMYAEQEAEAMQAKADEEVKIQEYLEANNITVEPTESGMYYIEHQQGSGPKPNQKDRVKVHYTGTLLDGKKFDSSVDRDQPFEFVLGVGQVIRGWDEGIAMMNVGSKATFILPSSLAYGEHGAGRDIPPYAPLIFEVELLDIVK